MKTVDTNLLLSAASEIESLRRQNEILAARADVIEVFAAALGLRNGHHGMAEDIAWKLRRIAEAPSEGDKTNQGDAR
jgi:hypothetical protein